MPYYCFALFSNRTRRGAHRRAGTSWGANLIERGVQYTTFMRVPYPILMPIPAGIPRRSRSRGQMRGFALVAAFATAVVGTSSGESGRTQQVLGSSVLRARCPSRSRAGGLFLLVTTRSESRLPSCRAARLRAGGGDFLPGRLSICWKIQRTAPGICPQTCSRKA